MEIRNLLLSSATAIGVVASLSGAAQARELSFAIGHPPVSNLVKSAEEAAKQFNEETGGEMTIKVYPLSLLSMAETSGGLREGLADIGTVMTPYFPNEFPHTNLIVESSMVLQTLGADVADVQAGAFAGAVSEFVMTKCPECVEEFAEQNQVFTGGAGTPPYVLNCTKPIVSAEDLKGARLRIGGANWARWSEAVGASPITMSGNEMLEALSQGVLDCIILSTPDIYNFGMGGAVTHITKGAPGGAYFASVSNINMDTWNELTAEQRTAFLRAMAKAAALGSYNYQNGAAEVEAKAADDGVVIQDAEPAVVEATKAFAAADEQFLINDFATRHGVERGEEMIGEFKELLDKWIGLMREAEGAEAYEKLFWDEIYAKIDVNSYGMR
ncbi:MAG: C4-dicarboxylate TRAP transporter substrate-binding protein [Aliihoeflea sp.]|uniref:C4-dicarboxylate TRAP transporter substrate-binding protein n=1 Tax=Aliihoeflea sp. TaxID=2608088 RepID=UPI004034DFEC